MYSGNSKDRDFQKCVIELYFGVDVNSVILYHFLAIYMSHPVSCGFLDNYTKFGWIFLYFFGYVIVMCF